METIDSILEELRKNKYPNMSDYYIKKEIKAKYNLKSVTKKDLLKDLHDEDSENFTQSMILPIDTMRHTLLYSDINTIVNLCTSNKLNICDNQFWYLKFKQDHLPLFKKLNTFNEWVKEYINVKNAQQEAINMVKIIIAYHKQYAGFRIHYKNESTSLIPNMILDNINNALPKLSHQLLRTEYELEFKNI